MHTKEHEKMLVENLINDDESAFCELYAAYKNKLIYFSIQFLKSKEYAEDIFQEAFTAIWVNRHFLDPESSFSSYVYTIVKNRILNQLSQIEKSQKLKQTIIDSAIDDVSVVEQRLNTEDLDNLLKEALQTLTPQQKKVFELSRKEMLSHKEIADQLGISVNTVQQHISASLKVIRLFLSKYGSYTDAFTLLLLLLEV